MVLLILVVLIYIFKSLFLSYLVFRQNRFLANVGASTSNRLFSKYLNQPFDFHINTNSSHLIKNLQTEVKMFGIYQSALLSVFVELGLLSSILLTLIFIEPVGAIFVGGFLGLLALVFYSVSKKKLLLWGNTRAKTEASISKILFETFGGIKEIKLLNVESYFEKKYVHLNQIRSRIGSNSATLNQLPRFYLELISVIGITLFIGALFLQGKDVPTLIATIGVFVAAVFRLIPSINKIITAFQNLKYHSSSVNIIYNEFLNLKTERNLDKNQKDISFKYKLKVKDLSFKYKVESTPILKNINLEINVGETIGLIGASGEGKSTFINLVSGLYQPSEGAFFSDNININNNISSWQELIGYVPQEVYLLDDTIENNIIFGRNQKTVDYDLLNKAIEKAQLNEFLGMIPQGLKTIIGERGAQISGGQKQRIGIARALYKDPQLLIFDESTSSLDIETESLIMNSIYSLKGTKTIIIIAHSENTLSGCDKIYEFKKTKIKSFKNK